MEYWSRLNSMKLTCPLWDVFVTLVSLATNKPSGSGVLPDNVVAGEGAQTGNVASYRESAETLLSFCLSIQGTGHPLTWRRSANSASSFSASSVYLLGAFFSSKNKKTFTPVI